MVSDKDVARLQESLDLLADFERRRTIILESLGHFSELLGESPAHVETTLDAAHKALNKHLFDTMLLFVPPTTDADNA